MNFEKSTKKTLTATRKRKRLKTIDEKKYEQNKFFARSQITKRTLQKKINNIIEIIDSMLNILRANQTKIRFNMNDADARMQIDQFVNHLEKLQNEIQLTKTKFNEKIKN